MKPFFIADLAEQGKVFVIAHRGPATPKRLPGAADPRRWQTIGR